MNRLIGTAIVWTILLAPVAMAKTEIRELVDKWGLTGKWSTDCSANAAGLVVSYEIEPDGKTTLDNGANLIEMRIESINSSGDLVLHTIEAEGALSRVLKLSRSGNTLRPVITGKEQNDLTVGKGKFVASLRETSPAQRCEQ